MTLQSASSRYDSSSSIARLSARSDWACNLQKAEMALTRSVDSKHVAGRSVLECPRLMAWHGLTSLCCRLRRAGSSTNRETAYVPMSTTARNVIYSSY